MNYIEIIRKENGPSGRMYVEKYIKRIYPELHLEIISYCNEKLNDISFKEKVYHYVHDIKEKILCCNSNCNNEVKFRNSTLGYYNYCSNKCISSDQKIKDIKEKKSYEKFGTKAPSMNIDVKRKMIKTNQETYGYNSPLQNENIKRKSKKTLFENYNVDNPNQSRILVERRIKSYSKNIKKKYLNLYKSIGVYDIDYKNRKMFLKCEKGHFFELELDLFHNRRRTNTLLCTVCNPINKHISGCELQLQDFIDKNFNFFKILNDRKILKPYEIDIYLPDLKLGFEFNGLFYHCEKRIENNYHLKKTELSEKLGIKLIQIYEDEWIYKQEIVKSYILNLLNKSPNKIFTRKCIVKEISDNKLVGDFLENNHLQGFVGSRIKLGLFYNNELVSLMIFKKCKNNTYEMLRFCNKLNTNIIGSENKLFKYFIKKYNPIEVISYADRSLSRGELYYKLGFKLIYKIKPNYYYVINRTRKCRSLYKKNILINQGFDQNKTEKEIMLDRKIYRIYDSGSLKFIWKK